MKQSAILVTSAGRRTSLVRAFLEAAGSRGFRVLAGDNNPLAPALYVADEGICLPLVLSDDYIPSLIAAIVEHGVKLIVPTIDTELPVLANHAGRLRAEGCTVLISSERLVSIARDKWLTVTEYAHAGIDTPVSWLPGNYGSRELPDRVFLKPRDGSASQHTHAIPRIMLDETLPLVPNAIIQEMLDGQEITIDAFLDLEGHPIHYVPRVRIRTMNGESIEGVTIDDSELRQWLIKILEHTSELGGRGALTLQAFLTDRGPVMTEINPRFGGGFPLTYAAGGHYPEWILRIMDGELLRPCFGKYRMGLYMTRYYVEHFTMEPLWRR